MIRVSQIFNQIVGIVAVNSTILVLSLAFWLLVGLTIHTVDYLNGKLRIASDRIAVSDSYSNNKKIYRGWSKYLHFARTAIRVSQEEEYTGSDGTFS